MNNLDKYKYFYGTSLVTRFAAAILLIGFSTYLILFTLKNRIEAQKLPYGSF